MEPVLDAVIFVNVVRDQLAVRARTAALPLQKPVYKPYASERPDFALPTTVT